jgi:hypothetical protein
VRIRVLGGGWYGSHLTAALLAAGHEVELHEIADRLFAGASGANPARLHVGTHYPRSKLTRAACQDHHAEFMRVYGHLTRGVPVNIYAVADRDSLLDFGTYRQLLRGEIEFITIERPEEFGLRNVEGAILCGERHLVIDEARAFFTATLGDVVQLGRRPGEIDDPNFDMTVDCTFCANDAEAIDRYEPCMTVLLTGKTDRSVTIMDGPFPSIYAWDEMRGLSSLTSAKYTPLSKECRSYGEAKLMLDRIGATEVDERANAMLDQMAEFWPEARERYRIADVRFAVRAMPRSAADARLVDVVRVGERALRVRAGKIDAIFAAERIVKEMIGT